MIIFAAYVVMTIVSTAVFMRWIAHNYESCTKGNYLSTCRNYHNVNCRKPQGVPTPPQMVASTGLGLAWPLTLIPLTAYKYATYQPKVKSEPVDLDELEARVRELKAIELNQSIKRLEKECEIK